MSLGDGVKRSRAVICISTSFGLVVTALALLARY